MTKSQNTKNEQQKDLCITSEQLTEQWKKGELKEGYYYVRDVTYILPAKLGKYDNQFYFSGNEVGYGYEENTELEVLAPVPDYNEYQKLLSDQLAKIEGEEIVAELEAENAQLKELLKSALSWFPDSSKLRGGRYAQLQNLKRKINEALK